MIPIKSFITFSTKTAVAYNVFYSLLNLNQKKKKKKKKKKKPKKPKKIFYWPKRETFV